MARPWNHFNKREAREVIAKTIGLNTTKVGDDQTFRSVGADELDIVNAYNALEQKYGTHIPLEYSPDITFGELIGFVENQRSQS